MTEWCRTCKGSTNRSSCASSRAARALPRHPPALPRYPPDFSTLETAPHGAAAYASRSQAASPVRIRASTARQATWGCGRPCKQPAASSRKPCVASARHGVTRVSSVHAPARHGVTRVCCVHAHRRVTDGAARGGGGEQLGPAHRRRHRHRSAWAADVGIGRDE